MVWQDPGDIWTSAAVLLLDPHSSHSCRSSARLVFARWKDALRIFRNRTLCLDAGAQVGSAIALSRVADRDRDPLFPLSVVCGGESSTSERMAELYLSADF
jgi:hypothetical protein